MPENRPEDQAKSDPAPAESQAAEPATPDQAKLGDVPVNALAQVDTVAQYVKDLSFENPEAANVLNEEDEPNEERDTPSVDVDIRVDTVKVGENTYEVALIMRSTAVSGEKTLFLVDLTYCGLFRLNNLPEDQVAPILRIHCPMLLFPFARHVIADATRSGGYPPLLINLIDFAQVYHKQENADKKAQEKR